MRSQATQRGRVATQSAYTRLLELTDRAPPGQPTRSTARHASRVSVWRLGARSPCGRQAGAVERLRSRRSRPTRGCASWRRAVPPGQPTRSNRAPPRQPRQSLAARRTFTLRRQGQRSRTAQVATQSTYTRLSELADRAPPRRADAVKPCATRPAASTSDGSTHLYAAVAGPFNGEVAANRHRAPALCRGVQRRDGRPRRLGRRGVLGSGREPLRGQLSEVGAGLARRPPRRSRPATRRAGCDRGIRG